MRTIPLLALALVPALGACAIATPDVVSVEPAGTAPAATSVAPGAYLPVREAPPTPFPATPPAPPESLDNFARRTAMAKSDAERAKMWEEANGSRAFQDEVGRLAQLLPEREPDNFVQIRLVRDETSTRDPRPLLGAEVSFKRDATATLAKYTDHPEIFARQGGLSEAEMEALRGLWLERLRDVGMGWGMSSDPAAGSLEVDVGVTEEAFRALAAEKGWSWGDEVRFSFAPPRPPAFADPALERQVRAFARENSRPGARNTALFHGRIVLEDGCFRVAGEEPALALFDYRAQLARDPEGYLIVAAPGETRGYRIGEPGAWGGPNGVDEDSEDVRRLRAACGEGPIMNVAMPSSLRSFSLPDPSWVLDYAEAYKLDYADAWRRVTACIARQERRGRDGLEGRNACVDQFNAQHVGRVPVLPPAPDG